MTPGARIAAAIDLLAQIGEESARAGAPADRVIAAYFRKRRYAGAKDRAAITERVWRILRHRGLLHALAGNGDAAPCPPRALVLADLVHFDGEPDVALAALFTGETYAPPPLEAEEAALARKIRETDIDALPPPARLSYPAWLEPALTARFGESLETEMAAFLERAPFDIRVNLLKAGVRDVRQQLAEDGLAAREGAFAPTALRFEQPVSLSQHFLFREGAVEIQDEGAQIAALLADTRPGHQVADLCAGAGGKTLAMAAAMANKGQIHAFDIDRGRLKELRRRLQRAGARNIQVHERGHEPDMLGAEFGAAMDRVLLDVPCSGSGTWRRAPDLKWRLSEARLADYNEGQETLLSDGAALVKPGGRLVYVTCSILGKENEDRIEAFLAANEDFRLIPVQEIWQECIDLMPPDSTPSFIPECVQLTPHGHGTDGFFVAVMERKQGA